MERERLSLSDHVYGVICKRIIEGKIRYGDKLNIKELSRQLQVSTMPVRDALKKLEMERVVSIKPRSNCIVTVPTKKSILDAIAMRILLEISALESVYAEVNDDDLAELTRIVAEMEDLIGREYSEDRKRRYIHLDLLYHTKLCSLAGNEYLEKFYYEVNLHMNMTFLYRIAVPDLAGTFRDHKRILEFLTANSPRAVSLLRKHMERTRSDIIAGAFFHSLG
jgi:DNA-binding GntR family transcriptional regulator